MNLKKTSGIYKNFYPSHMQKLRSDFNDSNILCSLNHEVYTFDAKLGLSDIRAELINRGDLYDPILDLC